MHNLSGRVNTRISSAGTDRLDRFVRHNCQRFFHALLHTAAGLLPLPAVIPGAVVLDAQCDANVWTC